MIGLIVLTAACVTGAPAIEEIAPGTSLPIGALVEVTGTGFVQGQTAVAIGAVTQNVVFGDATHVRFTVAPVTPLGPSTLTITVGGESDTLAVEVIPPGPRIDTIDPEPVYAENGAQPGDNGEKGAKAVQRYRAGAVKDTQPARSTSGTGGGGPR